MQKQTRRKSLSPASPVRTRSISREGGIKRAQSSSKLSSRTKSTVNKSMSNAVVSEASVTTQSITVTTNSVSVSSSVSIGSSNNAALRSVTVAVDRLQTLGQTSHTGSAVLSGSNVRNDTNVSQVNPNPINVSNPVIRSDNNPILSLSRTQGGFSSSSVLASAAAVITSSVSIISSAPGLVFSTPPIQPMAQSAGQPSGVSTVRDVEWPEGSEAIRMMFNSLTEPQKEEVADSLQALKYMRQRLRASYLMEKLVKGKLTTSMYAVLLSLSLSIPPTESEVASEVDVHHEEVAQQSSNIPQESIRTEVRPQRHQFDPSFYGSQTQSAPIRNIPQQRPDVDSGRRADIRQPNQAQSAPRVNTHMHDHRGNPIPGPEGFNTLMSLLDNSDYEDSIRLCSMYLADNSITFGQYQIAMNRVRVLGEQRGEQSQTSVPPAPPTQPSQPVDQDPITDDVSEVESDRPVTPTGTVNADAPPAVWNTVIKAMNNIAKNTQPQKKDKILTFVDVGKFNGNEGRLKALSWWYSFETDVTTQINSEVEVLRSFGSLMAKNSQAKSWYDQKGKDCKTLNELKAEFNVTFGPSMQDKAHLEDKIRTKTQHSMESFATYSTAVYLLNKQLGNPFGEGALLRLIYNNMNPEFQRNIQMGDFTSLETLSQLVRREEDYTTRKQLRKLQDNNINTEGIDNYEQMQELRKKHKTMTFRPTQQKPVQQPQHSQQQQPQRPQNNASVLTEQNQSRPPQSAPKVQGQTTQNTQSPQNKGEVDDSAKNKRKVREFDESKCTKRNCNETNFNPENEKDWKYYDPKMRCFACGRVGFDKFTCPYHNTLEQADANRERWQETQRKKKDDYRRRSKESNQENRQGEG